MAVPFVGRDREIELIVELEGRARTVSGPTLVTVTGIPGSGKTRLLTEATARARSRTIRVVGFEPMQSIALGAAGTLLRELASSGPDGAAVARLVDDPGDIASSPVRLFEAAHRALVRIGPVRLVIDDLQWVDPTSVALVDYLVRAAAARRLPLAVVAAGRPSRAVEALARRADDELAPERHAAISLGPLAVVAGSRLARALDPSLTEDAAAELWRRARGSPFYLGLLARAGGDDQPNPIRDRLSGLTGDGGRLLAAIAVAGRPVLVEDLGAVLDWLPERVSSIADDLIAHGVAVDVTAGIAPAHDLIREAILDDLPARHRQRLDERLADLLERNAGGDVLRLREALVHRRGAGGPTADLALRLVGSPNRRLLSLDDLRSLAAISDELRAGTSDRLTLDDAVGSLAGDAGDQGLAIDRFARVAAEAPDPARRRSAAIAAAGAAYHAGDGGGARAWLDRAEAIRPRSPAASIAIDAIRADTLLWIDHESAKGHEVATRAVATADELIRTVGGVDRLAADDRRAYLAAVEAAGDAALQLERPADIVRFADLSVAIAAGLDEAAEVAALNRAAFAYRTLGLVVDAERLGRRAWDVARRVILPAAMAEAGHSLARSLRELGRFAEARSVAAETVAIEARLQNPSRRWGNALSVLHVVDMCVGDPKEGLGRLRDDARREADPHYRLAVHQITAVWLARLDAPSDDILDELASADAASALARCPRCARELEIEGAGLLARAGSIDAAVRRLGQDPREPGDDYIHRHLRWLRSRAEIAAASGDHDGAVHHFADLVSIAEAAGLVEEVIWASIDLGRVSAPRDRAGAVAALRRAADLAGRAGGTTHHRVATRALRKLGVRTWRRTPRTDGGGADPNRALIDLSVREREVAALVAAGHSNREIGEALDIAPKTVERHVTNALTKLAVRNRTELAALMTGLAVRDSPDD